MAPDEKELWFVLYCEEDDSHCLISHEAVIYHEKVNVGDAVKFYYSGKSKLYDGTVKAFGEDYEEMKKEQDALNASTKPRREKSFHGEPRAAVLKRKTEGFVTLSGKSKKKKTPTAQSQPRLSRKVKKDNKPKKSVLGKMLKEAEDSASESDEEDINEIEDVSNDDSNESKGSGSSNGTQHDLSDSESSEEVDKEKEAELIRLLSQKRKTVDYKALMALLSSEHSRPKGKPSAGTEKTAGKSSTGTQESAEKTPARTQDAAEKTPAETQGLSRKSTETREDAGKLAVTLAKTGKSAQTQEKTVTSAENEDITGKSAQTQKDSDKPDETEEVNTGGQFTDDSPAPNIPKDIPAARRRRRKPSAAIVEYNGNCYLRSETDTGVEELTKNFDVYIRSSDLKEAKKCRTPTALCRSLMRSIFNRRALASCSVTGRPSTGKGSGDIRVRPRLHPDGVNAIIEFTSDRADRKNWPKPARSVLIQAMGNMMCEIDYRDESAPLSTVNNLSAQDEP